MKKTTSTFPKTDRVKAVQNFLETLPQSQTETAWKKERWRDLMFDVAGHFKLTAGEEIGLDITVRDALQNMALAGFFLNGSAKDLTCSNCPALQTEADEEAGACTQCGQPHPATVARGRVLAERVYKEGQGRKRKTKLKPGEVEDLYRFVRSGQ